jgi:uncharacterized protein (PEP-CTERM system associated)
MKSLFDMRAKNSTEPRSFFGKILPGSITLCLIGLSNCYADTWRIAPEVSLIETFSDNAALVPAPIAQNSWVTEVSPSVRIERLGGRASVLVDYRLRSTYFSNESRLNNNQNFLNATSTFEAVENWLYLDARSSITQQNRSAFDSAQLQNTTPLDTNRIETNTYQISPYIRGRFSDLAIYQLRFNGTETRTNDEAFPDTKTREWIGVITNAANSSQWGWLVSGNALQVRNDDLGRKQDNRIRASAIYAFSRQLKFSLIGGYERTDFASTATRSTKTTGAGVEWLPTDRTKFVAMREKRFFGDAYNLLLTHRTPLTAWKFLTTKDVVVLPNTLTTVTPGSVYELLNDVLSTSIPDPAARTEAVRRRLQDSAAAENGNFSSAFLTLRPFVSQSREGSVALLGTRNTMTLTYSRREQRDVGAASPTSAFQETDVLQRNWNLSWAHRLSPLSTVTVIFSRLRSESLSLLQTESKQRAESIVFTTRLSPKTSASLALRRVHFDSTALNSYLENALAGTILMRF